MNSIVEETKKSTDLPIELIQIAQYLKKYRESIKLSMQNVEDHELSKSMISRIEQGERVGRGSIDAHIEKLNLYAKKLGTTIGGLDVDSDSSNLKRDLEFLEEQVDIKNIDYALTKLEVIERDIGENNPYYSFFKYVKAKALFYKANQNHNLYMAK
ncbi:helix-turn-helix transcriptional regulator [Hazenella sp. IB182357]|uniref:Helix-turn-helix transcriptional regulator n=1 Tax=Polycladospora coralii TaxID=2771432 RepID=A0A926NCM3_9BACL|nr:helix-turn-helix transcriptional regulator [Polycladospora coralii]MBD1373782.1 helix-turn-helix transcriptional regulator [Polycladospora coralii]